MNAKNTIINFEWNLGREIDAPLLAVGFDDVSLTYEAFASLSSVNTNSEPNVLTFSVTFAVELSPFSVKTEVKFGGLSHTTLLLH
jgi:hypothetical protein